jgi:hypothetical protein
MHTCTQKTSVHAVRAKTVLVLACEQVCDAFIRIVPAKQAVHEFTEAAENSPEGHCHVFGVYLEIIELLLGICFCYFK